MAADGRTVEVHEKLDLLFNVNAGESEVGQNLIATEQSELSANGSQAALVDDDVNVVGVDTLSAVPNGSIPADGKVEKLTDMEEKKEGAPKAVANGNSVLQREENGEEHPLLLESDVVTILPHWNATPCVHITGLGGTVKEEDLLAALTTQGKIGSFVFENDRRDAAIVRYELSGVDSEDIVTKVRETISSRGLKGRSNIGAEAFRPDSLLFIGNLTPEIDDATLRQMFEPHGTIERAFVLNNAAGRSKGYGFVEYTLKSQASAAKVAMGNINMDGRVLRVEWSDCRKISDMFSTVLFVDRISKDSSHIEQTLRKIFGNYGRVRDCHLAVGINQQLRGFGFLDFYDSTCADKAHEALDGKEVDGSSIRVSFANPSKSAQSYKMRFGVQAATQAPGTHVRGSLSDQVVRPVTPMLGATMRGRTVVPVLGHRFVGQGRNGVAGMGLGMQLGRGVAVGPGMIGQCLVPPLLASGGGMLGPGSVAAGVMPHSPGMILGHSGQRGLLTGSYSHQASRIPVARGPVALNSTAIAQVATAQAKLREEEAKARAAAQSKQAPGGAKESAAEHERLEQFRKLAAKQAQLIPHHTYYQQHAPSSTLDQHYKQSASNYSYQLPYLQAAQAQSTPMTPFQHQSIIQHAPPLQQTQQSYNPHYYSQSAHQYGQQAQQPQQAQQQLQLQPQQQYHSQPHPSAQPQQQQQSSEQQGCCQRPLQQSSQVAVCSQQQSARCAQYGEQFSQQCAQQQSQPQQQQQQQVQQYGLLPALQQPYVEASQIQNATQYSQQDYATYYAQQQQPQTQQTQTPTVSITTTTAGLSMAQAAADLSQQQQAYASYYQQRAQEALAHVGTSATQTASSSTTALAGSLEAQWAAYYAAQAAQQQATAATSTTGNVNTAATAYDPQVSTFSTQTQPYAATVACYQQPASGDVGIKLTADQIEYSTQTQAAYGYQQQQPSAVPTGFSQQQAANGSATYQQQQVASASLYQQPASVVPTYHQLAVGHPQQISTTSGYATPAAGNYQHVTAPSSSAYQPPVTSVMAGYQQPSAATVSVYGQPNQTAVPGSVYDHSKRARY